MKIKTDTNKRIQTNIIIICIIVFILISFAVYAFLYDFYKGGIVGTAAKISDIPYIHKDFDELNAEGPFKYVYKIDHRTTTYMFTGKISEEYFKKFCESDNGWKIEYQEVVKFVPPYNYFKVNSSDFPTGDPKNNDLCAGKSIQDKKSNNWTIMYIYLRLKEGKFTAYINRSHRREDWDN